MAGFGAEPRPPEVFHLFSAFMVVSADTITRYNCNAIGRSIFK